LPALCCRRMRSSPPPASAWAWRRWSSAKRSSTDMAPLSSSGRSKSTELLSFVAFSGH